MKPFKLTREAKQDLRKIALFTEKRWGREQRYLHIKQFDNAFHLLAETPSIGTQCHHIKSGYRKLSQGSHITFYSEALKDNIVIIRILHKSMDVELRLLAD